MSDPRIGEEGRDAPMPVAPLPPPTVPPLPPLPAYYPAGFASAPTSPDPPRPKVEVGSWLLMLGGGVLIVGSLLTWWTVDGREVGGMYSDFGYEGGGPLFVTLGLALGAFGVAQLFAGRVKSVAILAVVLGALALIGALGQIGELDDLESRLESTGRSMSIGVGPWVVLVGSAIALAGAIATLSRRRRWPTPVS